jgi:photosystem II stability/assembly factor-like uncharacterized protein
MNRRRLALLTICGLSIAQGALGQDDDLNEGPDVMNARREWLFRQRAYPREFIPSDARARAVIDLNRQLSDQTSARAHGKSPETVQSNVATGSWTLIGPNPTINGSLTTAAWTNALAVDPTNANVAYLGAPEGGVWKTTDGGAHWIPLTDTQPSLAIASLAIDPNNHNTIFAGTGDSYLYGEGLLKSVDGGNTWAYISSPFAGPFNSSSYFGGGAHINQISIDPTNTQILLAAVWSFPFSSAGIYRSTDGGATWQLTFSGAPGTSVTFDPTNGNTAYAAISDYFGTLQAGIYKSIDGGRTWTAVNGTGVHQIPVTNGGLPNVGAIHLALAPASTSTLYISVEALGTFAPFTPNPVYKTTDGGTTWNPATNPFTQLGTQPGNRGMVLTVHPANPSIVFLGEQKLYRSLDGGTTWTDVTQSTDSPANNLFGDIRSFGFSAGGTTLYVGCDGGPWSTTDAANQTMNWKNLTSTLATTQFYPGLSIHPSNPAISFAGSQDQGVQQYAGSLTWNTVQACDGGWTAIDPITPSNVYAACQQFSIAKSTSGGTAGSFTQVMNGINTSDRVAFIPPMVIDPSYSQNLYFGTYRVYQTTNGAASWLAISGDLTQGGTATISSIAVAPNDSNRVYVGSSDGRVHTTANATAGAAAIWTDITGTLPNRAVSQVVVDAANGSIAYAVMSGFTFGSDTQGHVFKTTNAGATWTDISGNLPNVPADDLAIDLDFVNTFYLATDIGVFGTSDGGTTWTAIGTGLPRVVVSSLKIHRLSRRLRAATLGRSAWDLVLPPVPKIATMTLSNSVLNFGLTASGSLITDQQTVLITFTGSPGVLWTAASSSPNIVVNPTDGFGAGSIQVGILGAGPNGTVTITALAASNSPQTIQINIATVTPTTPFGSFDTPANNASGIAGAIPVTGWALDNIEVMSVGIWRNPLVGEPSQSNGLVYIGNATFVAGARPDVQVTFSTMPFNYRAGWGYMMLTNFLPSGNGIFKLHAIAVNKAGRTLDLGTRTITVDNAHASKPFGTIDTPDQGATASGSAFVNFGWALTQNPNCIPIDGSTITVYLDSTPVGHPVYNQFRSDIASLFPGRCNSNGAVGYFYIDTTQLANGVHSIAWSVTDNVGHVDGIGSRYFTVANTGGENAPAAVTDFSDTPMGTVAFRRDRGGLEQLHAQTDGSYAVEIDQLGFIELHVGATNGYMLVGDERRPLPVGSTLKGSVFYWQPTAAFLGEYHLVFEGAGATLPLCVKVRPQTYSTFRLQL